MDLLQAIFTGAMAYTVLLQTAPILLAALGGAFTDQGNILNIALEGMMLMGAFTAIIVGDFTHSWILAVVAAVASACVLGLLFAVASLLLKADPIVVGIGINLLATGIIMFLLAQAFGTAGSYTPADPDAFPQLPKLNLGPLKHIPIIGDALQGQTILVILALLLVPACSWLLFRTKFGTHLRSVGKAEDAAVAAGLKPRSIRFGSVMISAVFCGIAGAQLSMASLQQYTQNMTANRGFIAVAALTFGAGKPLGTFVASLIFGAANAITTPLQQVAGISSYLSNMAPYIITIIALVLAAYRVYRYKKTGRTSSSWFKRKPKEPAPPAAVPDAVA